MQSVLYFSTIERESLKAKILPPYLHMCYSTEQEEYLKSMFHHISLYLGTKVGPAAFSSANSLWEDTDFFPYGDHAQTRPYVPMQ